MKFRMTAELKFWGYSSQYNKFIRVVLENDGETIVTAFFDRDFEI